MREMTAAVPECMDRSGLPRRRVLHERKIVGSPILRPRDAWTLVQARAGGDTVSVPPSWEEAVALVAAG